MGTLAKEKLIRALKDEIRGCKRCPLWATRTNAVPGDGNIHSAIVFVGEAPGYHEDIQGRPFVGAAGKLLSELLLSIGLHRDEVYITNVVKCRPPNNRDPKREEIAACSPYLDEEIRIIAPRLIVTLGRHSTNYILSKGGFKGRSMISIHGKTYEVNLGGLNLVVMPTFHPAAALYNPRLKDLLIEDFKRIPRLVKQPRGQSILDDFL